MCFRHFSSPIKLTNFQFCSSSKCSFFHYSVFMQRICLFSLVLSLLGTLYFQLHLKTTSTILFAPSIRKLRYGNPFVLWLCSVGVRKSGRSEAQMSSKTLLFRN